jgi:hypothetical protein
MVDGTTNITNTYCSNSASLGSTCGGQSTVLAQTNLPINNYTPAGTITVTQNANIFNSASGTPGPFTAALSGNSAATITATFAGTSANIGGSATAFTNLPPLGLVYKIMKL